MSQCHVGLGALGSRPRFIAPPQPPLRQTPCIRAYLHATKLHRPAGTRSLRFNVRVNVCLNSARQSSVALASGERTPCLRRAYGADHPPNEIAWDALELRHRRRRIQSNHCTRRDNIFQLRPTSPPPIQLSSASKERASMPVSIQLGLMTEIRPATCTLFSSISSCAAVFILFRPRTPFFFSPQCLSLAAGGKMDVMFSGRMWYRRPNLALDF